MVEALKASLERSLKLNELFREENEGLKLALNKVCMESANLLATNFRLT